MGRIISMKKKIEFKDGMSWIIGAVGVFATLITAFCIDIDGFATAFVAILVTELLLVFIWWWNLWDEKRKNGEIVNLKEQVEQLKNKVSEQKSELESVQFEESKRREEISRDEGIIAVNIKNASKLYNEFCAIIPGITDETYHLLQTLQNSGIQNQEILSREIEHSHVELAIKMFAAYKRYSVNLLTYLVSVEEAHIRMRGFRNTVSATIKLFNKPYYSNRNGRSNIIVYTAFRDKATYDRHEREIGVEPYTIDGNADFVRCLRKDHFIINNAKRGSDDYLNEHIDFDAYYNCAIVVPIRIKQPDNTHIYLGYLCCDCLNDSGENLEIFEVQAANYLFSMAQLYASYIEAMESNWSERLGDIGKPSSTFLELVYKRTFKGKEKD